MNINALYKYESYPAKSRWGECKKKGVSYNPFKATFIRKNINGSTSMPRTKTSQMLHSALGP